MDYPHSTRAKKFFLVLMVGAGSGSAGSGVEVAAMPAARGVGGGSGSDSDADMDDAGNGFSDEEGAAGLRVEGRRRRGGGRRSKGGHKGVGKSRDWVLKKKAQMRARGYTNIPVDSKYTARRRKKIVV